MPYLAMALLDYHLALLFNANLRVSLCVCGPALFLPLDLSQQTVYDRF